MKYHQIQVKRKKKKRREINTPPDSSHILPLKNTLLGNPHKRTSIDVFSQQSNSIGILHIGVVSPKETPHVEVQEQNSDEQKANNELEEVSKTIKKKNSFLDLIQSSIKNIKKSERKRKKFEKREEKRKQNRREERRLKFERVKKEHKRIMVMKKKRRVNSRLKRRPKTPHFKVSDPINDKNEIEMKIRRSLSNGRKKYRQINVNRGKNFEKMMKLISEREMRECKNNLRELEKAKLDVWRVNSMNYKLKRLKLNRWIKLQLRGTIPKVMKEKEREIYSSYDSESNVFKFLCGSKDEESFFKDKNLIAEKLRNGWYKCRKSKEIEDLRKEKIALKNENKKLKIMFRKIQKKSKFFKQKSKMFRSFKSQDVNNRSFNLAKCKNQKELNSKLKYRLERKNGGKGEKPKIIFIQTVSPEEVEGKSKSLFDGALFPTFPVKSSFRATKMSRVSKTSLPVKRAKSSRTLRKKEKNIWNLERPHTSYCTTITFEENHVKLSKGLKRMFNEKNGDFDELSFVDENGFPIMKSPGFNQSISSFRKSSGRNFVERGINRKIEFRKRSFLSAWK